MSEQPRKRLGTEFIAQLPEGYGDGRAEMVVVGNKVWIAHPDRPPMTMGPLGWEVVLPRKV